MRKGIINADALESVYLFAGKMGFAVSWSGLCVWAVPSGAKPRSGSEVDKAMKTVGFSWSAKRRAYFCRAATEAVLPSSKDFGGNRKVA